MITTSAKTTSANGTSANGTPAGRRIGFACLAGAMVLVGTTVIASKTIAGGAGPGGMGPFTATALRFALAFPLFLLLMRWQRVRLPRPGWRDLGLLVVQAGLAVTVLTEPAVGPGLRTCTGFDGMPELPSVDLVLYCDTDRQDSTSGHLADYLIKRLTWEN